MYDSIIIGGGIAGLQAAIQLGRYRRKTLVIDRGDGRSTMCRNYHNVLGYPDGVSGPTLRELGRRQAEGYGVEFLQGEATEAERYEKGFLIRCDVPVSLPTTYEGKTILLATGVLDRLPPLDGLRACLGLSVFVCPDCDGYETEGKRTLVLGSGNTGAAMALALTYFCNSLTYVNHELRPIDASFAEKLAAAGIPVIDGPIERVVVEGAEAEGRFRGVRLASGATVEAERGFVAFGGNEVRSDLAKQLHVERLENRHIVTDARSKMTNVPGVWAAGDVAVHSEQLTIAMGEGQQAAIWMHKWLLAREREEARPGEGTVEASARAAAHSMATAGKP
ncbi:NAD(P)/FAD-dependent oxidoreductase [Paenibacillus sp.]|uniref:NAD(P)/FAD-dependent oxidoreductase n=1 Tax=Paenibacillus sp. TaxID=58172 RepID=UPI002D2BB1A3|nr:NAD(P)/FAD-dependent oxidoreductase [Paenibacillus sp.]HZG56869.1 NAD(P)/FAD-dependent oxidoreductase [Paenibacillus sp.]